MQLPHQRGQRHVDDGRVRVDDERGQQQRGQIGDRWTLLIVRELSLRAPCRYTDLRNGLPGIATNLLADRLRELEQAGLVSREEARPPIATTVFSLTSRGAALQPVLDELLRWGLPLMLEQKSHDAVRSHWLLTALQMLLIDRNPEGPAVTVELDTGDQPIVITTSDRALAFSLGPAAEPTVRVAGPPKPILALILGFLDSDTAEGLKIDGDATALDRFGTDMHTDVDSESNVASAIVHLDAVKSSKQSSVR